MALTGCNSQQMEQGNLTGSSAKAIQFSGSSGSEKGSRTSIENDGADFSVSWTKRDEIGIFGRSGQKNIGDNYRYIVLPDEYVGKLCKFAPYGVDKLFEWDGSEQSFFAYHPYSTTIAGNPAEVPVKLASKQVQSTLNSSAHLSKYNFMKANPVTLSATTGKPSGAKFDFHTIFSIVNFNLKMNNSATIDVPIRSVKLISKSGNLAFNAATIDLTRAIEPDYTQIPVNITEGVGEVELTFGTELKLNKTAEQSTYMLVAAGEHDADDLTLEVTASDFSVATIVLPAVSFKSNRNYSRSYTLDINDFKLGEEFDATIDQKTYRVGEQLTFALSGTAHTVGAFTGEKYSDYAYADVDRKEYPLLNVSFKTWLMSGNQPTPLKVKYSTNFNNTLTEAAILASTWTDMSDKFTLASVCEVPPPTTPDVYQNMIVSGTYDLAPLAPTIGSLYIGFFYHVDKYVSASANGRTMAYISDFKVEQKYKDQTTIVVDEAKDEIKLVNGVSYDSDGTKPAYLTYAGVPRMFRFTSSYQPTSNREAYGITIPISRSTERNVGKDTPTSLKQAADEMPATYTHTYTTAGTYKVVLVGQSETFMGVKKVVKEFTITITE